MSTVNQLILAAVLVVGIALLSIGGTFLIIRLEILRFWRRHRDAAAEALDELMAAMRASRSVLGLVFIDQVYPQYGDRSLALSLNGRGYFLTIKLKGPKRSVYVCSNDDRPQIRAANQETRAEWLTSRVNEIVRMVDEARTSETEVRRRRAMMRAV